jgi:phosphatidylinositol glycan class W
VHQVLLTGFLQPLVLSSSPRLNLFTQNKEGIVSLLGYLSIHILGLLLGTIVLPFSPSFFRKHQAALDVFRRTGNKPRYFDVDGAIETRYRQTGKTAQEIASYSLVWWVLFGVVRWVVGDVSRKLVCLSHSYMPLFVEEGVVSLR